MRRPLEEGEVLDLEVVDLAYGGAGVARVGGLVCFVPGTVPGDLVRARITSRRASFAEARSLAMIAPSPQRVPPPCDHFGACGGCHWMSLPYETQLEHKQRQVGECLARIGHLEGFRFHPIVPSPEILAYRNKTEFHFGASTGGVFAGLHRADDPAVLEEIHECLLQDEASNRILRWTVATARELGLTAASPGIDTSSRARATPPASAPTDREEPGEGLAAGARLRRLVIRKGNRDGRRLVAIVTGPGPHGGLQILAERMLESFPEVSGVVRVVQAAAAPEGTIQPLAGESTVTEELDGLTLTVTAGAFLQVNAAQAARLYRCVEELVAPAGGENILDLYCGAGAMTLRLARAARSATGVEASLETVRCAERNARANGVLRCRFVHGDAGRVAADRARAGARYEAVIVNPPRAGLGKEVVRAIPRLGAARIVYVSCDPATLARDLARFGRLGYRTTDVAPFDMFPQTYHVEVVARLERME